MYKDFFSKKNIVSLFIIIVMVSSILAIWQGASDSNQVSKYNGYSIRILNEKYQIETDTANVYGYTYPSFLEYIPLDKGYVNYLLSSDTVFILFEPADENIAVIEVLRSELAQQDFYILGKMVNFGLITANETYNYPVLSCSNITQPALYLHTINITLNITPSRIYQEQGCIVLEASTWQELLQLKDRLVYTMYGVME